jgi:hypothetical protein
MFRAAYFDSICQNGIRQSLTTTDNLLHGMDEPCFENIGFEESEKSFESSPFVFRRDCRDCKSNSWPAIQAGQTPK